MTRWSVKPYNFFLELEFPPLKGREFNRIGAGMELRRGEFLLESGVALLQFNDARLDGHGLLSPMLLRVDKEDHGTARVETKAGKCSIGAIMTNIL